MKKVYVLITIDQVGCYGEKLIVRGAYKNLKAAKTEGNKLILSSHTKSKDFFVKRLQLV